MAKKARRPVESRTIKGKAGPPPGRRGAKGEGGAAGERGPVGPAGPPGPVDSRYNALAEKLESISHELMTQFQRFAQVQQQVDEVARALKNMQEQRGAKQMDK